MFKARIALLSVMVSGVVLVAFGFFFLSVVNRVRIERIDRELRTLGESQLHDWHPKKDWKGFERSILSIYGQKRWTELIVYVIDGEYRILYNSPHWPQEISTASFPGFDDRMEIFPSPYGNDPHPPVHYQLTTPPETHVKKPVFKTLKTSTGVWRTGIMGSQFITIMIGMDMAGFYEDAARYRKAFYISIPLALLLLACGGWLVAYRAIKPVADITRTAQKITARDLNQRIIAKAPDTEMQQLVRVINNMLDRLEKSFSQAVRFSADAAHELQTPLTILQGTLDNAVQNSIMGSDEQEQFSFLLEEVSHLKSIVRKLLILAQADAGRLPLNLIAVDLNNVLESAAEDAEVIGPHLTIETRIQSGVTVLADPDLLRMVIQGLTVNAVKYNTDAGLICFDLRIENQNALLSISNTGSQIPEEARDRIFDRFYRVDKSRNHCTSGTGLGLSLAREIIHAHNGKIELEPAKNDLTIFSLSLPL